MRTQARRHSPPDHELDKIARNIKHFDLTPGGQNDIKAYLDDLTFYLRRLPEATIQDYIYLIKSTANREVSILMDHQPVLVWADLDLHQSLEREFSDETVQSGRTSALNTRQDKQEPSNN